MRQVGDPKRNYPAEWKAWRKQHGWTQQQMGQVLNLTNQTICNIERGQHRPALRSRMRLNELQERYRESDLYGIPLTKTEVDSPTFGQ